MSDIILVADVLTKATTAADWAVKNPVLRAREEGIELDTGRRKVGDGVFDGDGNVVSGTAWNDLPYFVEADLARRWEEPVMVATDSTLVVHDKAPRDPVIATFQENGGPVGLAAFVIVTPGVSARVDTGVAMIGKIVLLF